MRRRRRRRTVRLYYAGYQPPAGPGERFRVFSGVAAAPEGEPDRFARLREAPLLRTSPGERLFRVVHSLLRRDDGTWRCWYGAGHEFRPGRTKLLPVYDIRQLDSADGLQFPDRGEVAVPLGSPEEHRVGRPHVVRQDPGWRMYFGAGTEETTYRLTFADSRDGATWRRHDGRLGLDVSRAGWDSGMVAYPAVVTTRGGARTSPQRPGTPTGRPTSPSMNSRRPTRRRRSRPSWRCRRSG